MKRIRVPEEMLKAACDAYRKMVVSTPFPYPQIQDKWGRSYEGLFIDVLEAALLWLSEHPQVPTDEQLQAMREHLLPDMPKGAEHFTSNDLFMGAVEWQRRCFVVEESEIPAEIKDLLWSGKVIQPADETIEENDRRICEAFRRGLRKGDKR